MDEVPAVLWSPGHRTGWGRGAIPGVGANLPESFPSCFIRVWLEHDSDHLSCPSPEGSVRNSSTLTFRLEEVGRQRPHGNTFPGLSSRWAEVGAGDRDPDGLGCAGHSSTCVDRPVSRGFRRAFGNWHEPCPENHVAPFLNVSDALLLPKELSESSLPFLWPEFTGIP